MSFLYDLFFQALETGNFTTLFEDETNYNWISVDVKDLAQKMKRTSNKDVIQSMNISLLESVRKFFIAIHNYMGI